MRSHAAPAVPISGVIVEPLDKATALVEFSDDKGQAYAVVPCPRDTLLVLRTTPLAA